jgi:hypothetical protein
MSVPGGAATGGNMAFQGIMFTDADEFSADDMRLSGVGDGPEYLLHPEDETGLVGLLARQVAVRVRDLEVLMRSNDPNMREVCARLVN